MSATLLVTGAAGHLGQRVIAQLLDTLNVPARNVIATTRNPDKLAALAARGVSVRRADFDDPASLAAAFAGAQRLLLISTDVLDRPGHRLVQHRNAVEAATKAGVAHVVYTSMPNPESSAVLFAPDHLGTERALVASPLSWTVLRNHWYMENLFFTLPSLLATGKWFSAAGDGRLAWIARDDCALAAATALAGNDTGRRTLTLSGTEAFTTEETARMVSETAGRPIGVVQVSHDGLIQGMVAAGMPQPVAAVFASFDANTKAGGFADVSDDFKQLTGRKPMTYRDWLAANRLAISG